MNKSILIASMLLKVGLLSHTVMAAEDRVAQQRVMANLTKDKIPAIERSLLKYAKAGDDYAQLALARIYESDNKHQPNLKIEWYKKSAINGNAEAQFQLGLLYADGEIPDGDWDTGLFWIEMAAEQGHQQAGIVFESMENEYYSIGC